MLRCAASIVTAAYAKYASQGTGLNLSPFARLASELFTKPSDLAHFSTFYEGVFIVLRTKSPEFMSQAIGFSRKWLTF